MQMDEMVEAGVVSRVGVTDKMGFGFDDRICCTFTRAQGFSVFTIRILATAL
jgi:hypothetical protein